MASINLLKNPQFSCKDFNTSTVSLISKLKRIFYLKKSISLSIYWLNCEKLYLFFCVVTFLIRIVKGLKNRYFY